MKNQSAIARYFSGLLFATVLFPFSLGAQQLIAAIDKDTIALSETAVFIVTGEVSDISSFPDFSPPDGITISSRSNNFSFDGVSGKIKIKQSFTLQASKAGTYLLGPVNVQSGGNRIFSNAVTLVVKNQYSAPGSGPYFLSCEPDKKTAYLGQLVVLNFRLYHREGNYVSRGSESPSTSTLNGFWYYPGSTYYDLYDSKDSVVYIKGKKYIGQLIYREFVFPNSTGRTIIPSYDYFCNSGTTSSYYDDYDSDNSVELHSAPVAIDVNDYPADNKPSGFAGDAGVYSIVASIDKKDLKAFEAFKITVVISGKGDVPLIQPPKLQLPDSMQTFDPVSSDTSWTNTSGISGYKTFVYTVIPQKEGKYDLPGVSFSYYDTQKDQYVTLTTKGFHVNVQHNDKVNVSDNNSFHPVQNDKTGQQVDESAGSSGIVFKILLFTLAPIILAGFIFWFVKRRKLKNNAGAGKNAEGTSLEKISSWRGPDAKSILQSASQAFTNGNLRESLRLANESLVAACCIKCGIAREEASTGQIRYRLELKKVSPALTGEIVRLLEKLASLLYLPAANDPLVARECLDDVQRLLNELN